MRIAITGSNGFIGSELVKYFIANGHQVLLLQRRHPAVLPLGAVYQKYDLDLPNVLPNLIGVDALIHTAYMPFTEANQATEKNIQSTLALYKACVSKGVQFVFLSSMSAHANALSQYGRHKFVLEQQLDSTQCLVLKLGLVIGKDGLFSRMYKSFKRLPFAVVVGGGMQPIQPVYIGDVLKVISESVATKRTGIYILACNRAYTMRELFTAIAHKAGSKPLFISIPYSLVGLGIGAVELLRLPFPVSKENLLGLKQLQAVDTESDLQQLNITPLDLNEAIALL